MERAQNSGYGALYLRAVFFTAEDKRLTGDQAGASADRQHGPGALLVRADSGRGTRIQPLLWAGPCSRSFNRRPNLQVAIWREAVALIDSDEDLLQRATAHSLMANAAMAARLPQIAEQQYAEAARLFAAAPRTEASRNACSGE